MGYLSKAYRVILMLRAVLVAANKIIPAPNGRVLLS